MVGHQLGLAAVLLAPVLAATQLCDLEHGFDYLAHDLSSVQAPVNQCCSQCKQTPGCRAWSWNAYKNGTCWLKDDVGSIVVNPGVTSARVVMAGNACYIMKDVDFVGNDIGNVQRNTVGECCDVCRSTLSCRAYSWNNYNGGTCWLKSTRDKAIVKTGVISAEAYPNAYPFTSVVFALEAGVDYVGYDMSNVQASDPLQCRKLCSDAAPMGCWAFSWNTYNGGTCWLKNGKNQTVANSGVTSGFVVSMSPA